MDDIDLSGLGADDAKAYIFEFVTTLKSTEMELARIKTDLDLWTKRLELAVSKGAAELQAAASAKVSEISAKFAVLEGERDSLRYKVSRLKEKLPMVGMSERSVDADLLLAEMQMATGEAMGGISAASDAGLKALDADSALESLKRKINGVPPIPGNPS